jgi:PIN domain nuclease of toxin-antitoxin system
MKSSRPKKPEDEILTRDKYKDEIELVLGLYDIKGLPFNLDHTEHLYTLSFFGDHKDPSDRMIIAKAFVEDAAIISSEGKLYYYGFQEEYRNVWTQPGTSGS